MIRIGDSYEIDTDERNYILYALAVKRKGKRAGEEGRAVVGYFQTLEQALRAIVDRNTINGLDGEYGLATALERLADIQARTVKEIRDALGER